MASRPGLAYSGRLVTRPITEQTPVKVGLISLGCAKNLVDAEIMLGSLLKAGMEITNDASQADVVIVNTCSFIDHAQEESVDTILQSSELREKTNPSQGLVVSGCLPQRFRTELPKLMPEVDAFMGVDQVAQAHTIVQEALEHRSRRMAASKPALKKGKKKVSEELQALDRNQPREADEKGIRGTAEFGN